jgi:hypothetical protein
MSTLTTDRQPPRTAVEIVRLLLEALVEPHKTAGRESPDSDAQPPAIEKCRSVRTPQEAS